MDTTEVVEEDSGTRLGVGIGTEVIAVTGRTVMAAREVGTVVGVIMTAMVVADIVHGGMGGIMMETVTVVTEVRTAVGVITVGPAGNRVGGMPHGVVVVITVVVATTTTVTVGAAGQVEVTVTVDVSIELDAYSVGYGITSTTIRTNHMPTGTIASGMTTRTGAAAIGTGGISDGPVANGKTSTMQVSP